MNNNKYRQGVTAAKAGDLETACKLFSEVVRENPEFKKGWVALGRCLEDPAKKAYCFERALSINLENEPAKRWLHELNKTNPPDKEQENLSKIQKEDKPPSENISQHPKQSTCSIWIIAAGFLIGIIFVGWILYSMVIPDNSSIIDQVAHFILPIAGNEIPGEQPTNTLLPANILPPTWTPTPSPSSTPFQTPTPTPTLEMFQWLKENYADIDLALQKMNSGNYRQAILLWDEVIAAVPEYPDAYYQRGLCYLSLIENQNIKSIARNDLLNADSDFTRAINLGPPKGDYYHKRAEVADALARMEEFSVDYDLYNAQAFRDTLLMYTMGSSFQWGNRSPGVALLNLGRCEESLDFFLRLAEERGPNATPSGNITGSIADSYFCLGDAKKALDYATLALSIRESQNFNISMEKIRVAVIYHGLSRYQEALDLMNEVIDAYPNYGGWRYYIRALIYFELGESDLALSDLEFGSNQTWEKYGYRAYVMGLLAQDAGNDDDALYWFQLAEASLRKHFEPIIYEHSLEEISKLGGELLYPTPTPTFALSLTPTPIPVVADDVYFTPTPPVRIPQPSLANFSGTGIIYLPANGTQLFLFRPSGYHNIPEVKSLTIQVWGKNLRDEAAPKILFMALDGSGFKNSGFLKVGENYIANPQLYVSSAGFFYASIKNTSGSPLIIKNISVQLSALDQNGSEMVYGYK